jgi:vacuolar-type H+-ATPase subunit H
LSTEIEELTRLVEEERLAEERIEQARSKAEEIIKKAREEATRIMRETQASLSSTNPQTHRREEFEEEKRRITSEHQRKLASLKKLAEKNLDRVVKMIVEETTRVES